MKFMPFLSNKTVDVTMYNMNIRWCLYYKYPVHSSRYVVAQGIELE